MDFFTEDFFAEVFFVPDDFVLIDVSGLTVAFFLYLLRMLLKRDFFLFITTTVSFFGVTMDLTRFWTLPFLTSLLRIVTFVRVFTLLNLNYS